MEKLTVLVLVCMAALTIYMTWFNPAEKVAVEKPASQDELTEVKATLDKANQRVPSCLFAFLRLIRHRGWWRRWLG
jgi:beta-lactam-binding protein with PASTA domain